MFRRSVIGASALLCSLLFISLSQAQERPYLGICFNTTVSYLASTDGFVELGWPITSVQGPAATAGVLTDDLIIAVDGQPAYDYPTILCTIQSKSSGDVVVLTLARGAQPLTLAVTLGRRPEDCPPNVDCRSPNVAHRTNENSELTLAELTPAQNSPCQPSPATVAAAHPSN